RDRSPVGWLLLLASSGWTDWLVEKIAEYSYAGVFFFLVACGLGFPCPEEVALIGGGYAIYLNKGGPEGVALMIAVAMFGVLCGDSVLYFIGMKVGNHPEKLPFVGHHLTPKRMKKARLMFAKHGAKAVFFGRFLFGIRAVTFFVAGSMRVPWGKFLLMDGLAGMVSVPISVFLAWYYGARLEEAWAWVRSINNVTLIVVLVAMAIVGFFVWKRWGELTKRFDESGELPALAPGPVAAPDAAVGDEKPPADPVA
ncbi:MAG: DedA family protein, partial [Planctomycetes bacterium]|nr:DedA family protein [Planctomycetota bacterium]